MHAGQQSVEDGSIGLEVVAFDVEHPPVARLHQHRNLPLACGLTDQELHVERVALLNDQVEPVEEGPQVFGVDALGDGHHPEIRVDLGDPSGGHDGLVHAEVEHAGRDAVEVRKFDGVEVRQAQFARQAFHGQDVGDGVARTEPDDANAQRALAGLFLPGELVAVAVQPKGSERTRAEQPHHGSPPGVIDPPLPLVLQGGRGWWLDLGELRALLGQAIDDLERRVLTEDSEHLALVSEPDVEHQRAPRSDPRGIGRRGAAGPGRVRPRELLGLEPDGQALLGCTQLLGP